MDNKFNSFNKYELTPDIVDLVVESFLSKLILFRSYVRIDGKRKKSILNCSLEYPFIKEYFDRYFTYENDSYEFSNGKILKLKFPSKYSIIENIGSQIDTNALYNSEYNHKHLERFHNDEIDFIFVNLNSLHKILFTVTNGVISNHIRKLNKELQRFENDKSSKINSKKNSNTDYITEDIAFVQDKITEYEDIDSLIKDKLSLVSTLIKFCRTEMLHRARKNYSKRLQYCMNNKGVNSSDIIHLLDIKQQTYSDYVNEKTLADNLKLIMLSKTLDCSIDFLLGLSDTINYTAYRSHFAFKKFGFSAEAFNKLSELRQNHAYIYSDIVNTFNHLLEEENLNTLYNISNYLKQADPWDYHTIKTTDLDNLRDTITSMVDNGASGEDVKQTITEFKSNLPKQNITDDEATTLLNIQQNLINLKKESSLTYNERAMEIFSELWINGQENYEFNYHPIMFDESEQSLEDSIDSQSAILSTENEDEDLENTDNFFINTDNDYEEEVYDYLPFDDEEEDDGIETENPYKD